jgi:hypothetical protein
MEHINHFLDQEAPKGNAGGKMKDAGTAHWNNPNVGLTAVVSQVFRGYRDFIGPFYSVGYYGYWWSSTESNTQTPGTATWFPITAM